MDEKLQRIDGRQIPDREKNESVFTAHRDQLPRSIEILTKNKFKYYEQMEYRYICFQD